MNKLEYHLTVDVMQREFAFERGIHSGEDKVPFGSGFVKGLKIYGKRLETMFVYPYTIFRRMLPPYRYNE